MYFVLMVPFYCMLIYLNHLFYFIISGFKFNCFAAFIVFPKCFIIGFYYLYPVNFDTYFINQLTFYYIVFSFIVNGKLIYFPNYYILNNNVNYFYD